MKIRLMFTKTEALLSRMIMWSTQEPISHFAIGCDLTEDGQSGIVFESDLLGARVVWAKDFTHSHEIVYELSHDMTAKEQKDIFSSVIDSQIGFGYNFLELIYFGGGAILHRLIQTKLPVKSPFFDKRRVLCTDLAKSLPRWLIGQAQLTEEVITPYQLYNILKDHVK